MYYRDIVTIRNIRTAVTGTRIIICASCASYNVVGGAELRRERVRREKYTPRATVTRRVVDGKTTAGGYPRQRGAGKLAEIVFWTGKKKEKRTLNLPYLPHLSLSHTHTHSYNNDPLLPDPAKQRIFPSSHVFICLQSNRLLNARE